MKNNNEKYWFYEFKRQNSFDVPMVILPGIWFEEKHQGLYTKSYKITLAFLYYRIYFYFGYQLSIPTDPINSSRYNIDSFSKWISKWAKKRITSSEIEGWAQNSDFKNLIKHGGFKYHYGKIILAREYMSQSNTKPAPKSKAAKQYKKLEDGEIEINIDLED